MVDKLFDIGLAQGLGIFFFLFLAVGAAFWFQNKMIMKQNENREARYISTIDKLADSFKEITAVNQNVAEMRKELTDRNNRQDLMLDKILDKLPTKID